MAYPDALATNKADATTTPTDHPEHHNSLATYVNENVDRLAQVPEWVRYLGGRLDDETANGLDDFFTSDTTGNYTELTVTGTADWGIARGCLYCKVSGQTAGDATAMIRSLGGLTAPVTVEVAIRRMTGSTAGTIVAVDFTNGVIATSAAGGAYVYGVTTAADAGWHEGTLTGLRAAADELDTGQSMLGGGSHAYMRVIWKSTNTFTVQFSADGLTWWDFAVGNNSFTLAPTHFALVVSNYGSSYPTLASFEYVRVYESDLSS